MRLSENESGKIQEQHFVTTSTPGLGDETRLHYIRGPKRPDYLRDLGTFRCCAPERWVDHGAPEVWIESVERAKLRSNPSRA